jgi:ATP-dependent Clp protease ATP-binding subunit ClpC
MDEDIQAEGDRIVTTPRTREVMARARQIAEERGHAHLGTEHLLLALLDDDGGIASQVLDRVGNRADLRDAIESILAEPGYLASTRRIFS